MSRQVFQIPQRNVLAATTLSVALVAIATGCAARNPAILAPSEFRREVARRGLDPDRVVNPLEPDPALVAAAADLAGSGTWREQLDALQQALFDEKRFVFDYESRQSLTARDALAQRAGNCVSFTNLFIALARSRGIPARAALLNRAASSERTGDLVVVNNHVVAAYLHAGKFLLYDFSRQDDRAAAGFRVLDDLWVAAIYQNNLGVERLREGAFARAEREFETAARLAPDFAGALGNLGVVRRRLGDVPGSFDAYRQALLVAPRDPAILGNLAALFRSQGREREAREVLATADMKRATPWTLLVRGHVDLADGRTSSALRLYRRARRLLPEDPEPHVAIAIAEKARGRLEAARRALERALDLEPGHPEARSLLDGLRAGRIDRTGDP